MIADLFRELMQATAASTAAVLVIAALRKPLRKLIGAEAAYRVWLLVPAAMLAVWLPAPRLAPAVAKVTTVDLAGAVSVRGTAPPPTFDWVPLVLLVWAVGMVVAIAYFTMRQRRFNQRIERRPGELFDTVEGDGPAVVGGWRARIVLPMDFRDRYSDDEQRLILAHEFQHVRRGDLRAQTMATALRGLFWFNPVIHVGANLLRFDQELACDAAVLKQFPQERRRYADTMLKTQLAQFGLPLACHWQASHSLKERITMLKQPLPTGARRIAGGLLTLALMSGGAYSAWASQPGVAMANATMPALDDMATVTRLTNQDHVTPPKYPAAEKGSGVTGRLWLGLLVDVEGHVKDAKLISAEPAAARVFEQVAIDSARQWIVHPSDARDGRSYERWVKMMVIFTPDDDESASEGSGVATASDEAATPFTHLHDDETLTTPAYPPEALKKGVEGKVVLDVLEGVDGRMAQIKVASAEPAGVFEAAAIAAARQWKLRPYLENGVPVEHWWRIPVQFATHDPDAVPVKAAEAGEAAGGTIDAQSRALNPPKYPAAALARAEDGKVVLEVDYDFTGKPTAIKVVDSEPAGVFDAAVLAAAWKWRFTPAIENGQPVAGRARVPVTFKAKDPAANDNASAKS